MRWWYFTLIGAIFRGALKPFWRPKDEHFYQKRASYLSRVWNSRGVDQVISALRSAGNENMYSYRFDWDENAKYLGMDFSLLFGATHGVEMGFIFSDKKVLGPGSLVFFPFSSKLSQLQMTTYFQTYWANFARHGTPNNPDLKPRIIPFYNHQIPFWEKVESGNKLIIDSRGGGGTRMVPSSETDDQIAQDLASDHTLSLIERCQIRDAIFEEPIETMATQSRSFDTLFSCR